MSANNEDYQKRITDIRANAISRIKKTNEQMISAKIKQVENIKKAQKRYLENLQRSREIIGKQQTNIKKYVNEGNVKAITRKRVQRGISSLEKLLSMMGAKGESLGSLLSDPQISSMINQLKTDLTNSQAILEAEKKTAQQKDEFASMVSHELKTPLVTINGYTEMLREGIYGKLSEDQLDAVEEIRESGMRLERLIKDVLDVQKLEMGKMNFETGTFNVSDFMKKTTKDLLPMMKVKKIEFINSNVYNDDMISDKNRLFQVFRNIIANAVDFVPEVGGRIEIGGMQEDENVVFYIKDNGKGIPKEKQTALFTRFYQIDTSATREHGGSGLGLSICKGIIEAQGGNIWVESEEGKGSIFYFKLPIGNMS